MSEQATPDEREFFATWNDFHERRFWSSVVAKSAARGERSPAAEQALEAVPAVTALAALEANAQLVGLLIGRRWFVMQAARDAGADWAEIGAALGVSKQAAWEFYKRKVADQERYAADFHDAGAARAVL